MRSIKFMSVSRLREAFAYDPDTGELRWRIKPHSNGCAQIGGLAGTKKNGYLKIVLDQVQMAGHRVAWAVHFGDWPRGEIDHINGNRSDNRLCNLRDIAPALNVQNRRRANRNNACGHLGVHQKKDGRWVAQIVASGRTTWLGRFDTPELAHEAYVQAKRRLHEAGTL